MPRAPRGASPSPRPGPRAVGLQKMQACGTRGGLGAKLRAHLAPQGQQACISNASHEALVHPEVGPLHVAVVVVVISQEGELTSQLNSSQLCLRSPQGTVMQRLKRPSGCVLHPAWAGQPRTCQPGHSPPWARVQKKMVGWESATRWCTQRGPAGQAVDPLAASGHTLGCGRGHQLMQHEWRTQGG